MFERATIFSALCMFILFCVVGAKYYEFIEAKKQGEPTAVTSSP